MRGGGEFTHIMGLGMENYASLMFTDTVQALQEKAGTRAKYQTAYIHRTGDALNETTRQFLETRESLYIASVSKTGWPYIQHRGGPQGFVKVIGDTRIAFADYKGNRQFITQGNLADNARVSVFAMDYLEKARLKLQGHARLTSIDEAEPDVAAALDLSGPAERVLVIDITALDWNCPKYIPDFFPKAVAQQAIAQATAPLLAEIEALKSQLQTKKGAP